MPVFGIWSKNQTDTSLKKFHTFKMIITEVLEIQLHM